MRTRPSTLAAAAAVLVCLPSLVSAAEAGEYHFAITPLVGFRLNGDIDVEDTSLQDPTEAQLSLDDGGSFGFILNAPAEVLGGDNYTEWEFYFGRQSVGADEVPAGVDPGFDIDITHYMVGGTYVGAGERMRPYLAAGIGAAHLSPEGGESDTVFAFNIGVGAHFFPESRVGLRVETRALGSVIDSDTAIFCASGPEGSGCAFLTRGDVLWQWEVSAGLVARF